MRKKVTITFAWIEINEPRATTISLCKEIDSTKSLIDEIENIFNITNPNIDDKRIVEIDISYINGIT